MPKCKPLGPLLGLCLLATTLTACGKSRDQVGTQSNWLHCEQSDDCGVLACLCGRCTAPCETDSDCSDLDSGAVCARRERLASDGLCEPSSSSSSDGLCIVECTADEDCAEASPRGVCDLGICLAAATAVDAGTAPSPPSNTGGAPAAPPPNQSVLPEPPTGPDRRACLAPPYTLAATEDRVMPVACNRENQVAFQLPGGTPATREQTLAFVDAHLQELFDLGAVMTGGWGTCCAGDWPAGELCMSVGVPLCDVLVGDLVQQLLAWQQGDPATASLRFNVTVDLIGRLEPRCAEGECGPMPHGEHTLAEPNTRTTIDAFFEDGPACSHDGECLATGCGNECLHWTADILIGTCPEYVELAEAFCGCVDNRCAWFE